MALGMPGRDMITQGVALMDGPIDVLVWNEELQVNELWEEGKLVTINGSVRFREDQMSISCNSISEFVIPEVADEENADDQPQGVTMPAAASSMTATAKGNGLSEIEPYHSETIGSSGSNGTNGSSSLPSSEVTQEPVEVSRRLGVRIRESGRPEDDKYLLLDLKNVLMEYQGKDEVLLEIATDGRIVTMEWPMVRVNACDELQERLRQVLGDSGFAYVDAD